mgnify:CR=1 FL=1
MAIRLSHTEEYVASRAPGGVCTLSYAEAAALVRLARAVHKQAEADPEWGHCDLDDFNAALDETNAALDAFDFTE